MTDPIKKLAEWKLVPVIAIDSVDDVTPLADALQTAGLACAEITLRTDAAVDSIKRLAQRDHFLVGAGTVHSVEDAARVIDAGAQFIVTPGLNPKTVTWCLDQKIPIIPGISTATDLELAIELNLSIVKFFPAEACGGIKMLKALSGPYGSFQFVPTGGISQQNLAGYLALPCVLACGGSWMVQRDLIQQGQFDEITKRTRTAIKTAQSIS